MEKMTVPDVSADTLLEVLQDKLDGMMPSAVSTVRTLAARLPPFSGNILELHFDRDHDRIDFATRINTRYDAAWASGYCLPAEDHTIDRLTGGYHGIENVWIEYDAPFTGPPAVFFDPYRQVDCTPQTAYDCVHQIAGELGHPVTSRLLSFLHQLHHLHIRVGYYGLMFSRQTPAIRLTLHGITPGTLVTRLHQLGWKGNDRVLETLRVNYLHAGQELVIGVDLGEDIGVRIGIEVFDKAPGTFIHTLYQSGRINARDAALFASWPGCRLLPEDVRQVLEQQQQRPADRLYTRINHFKFVVDDTAIAEVKGYLYYCY